MFHNTTKCTFLLLSERRCTTFDIAVLTLICVCNIVFIYVLLCVYLVTTRVFLNQYFYVNCFIYFLFILNTTYIIVVFNLGNKAPERIISKGYERYSLFVFVCLSL